MDCERVTRHVWPTVTETNFFIETARRYLSASRVTGLEARRSWISRHLGNGCVDAIFSPLVHRGHPIRIERSGDRAQLVDDLPRDAVQKLRELVRITAE